MSLSVGPESIGYLSRARALLRGVRALAKGPADSAGACHFLAAWTLKLTLKAYLSHSGWTTKQLRRIGGTGHDLRLLWEKAVAHGLSIAGTTPRWCLLLNDIHNLPYHSRYPTQWNAAVVPGIGPMTAALEDLFAAVETIVQPA